MRPDVLDIEADAEKVKDEKAASVKKQNSRGTFYQKLAARRDSFRSTKGLAANTANADVPVVPPSSSTSEERPGEPKRKGVQFGSTQEEDPPVADQDASAGQLAKPSLNAKTGDFKEPLTQGVDPVAPALGSESEQCERRQSSALDLATDEPQTQEPLSLADALMKRHTYSNTVLPEDVMPGMENYDTSWVNDGLSDSSSDDDDAGFDLSLFSASTGQLPDCTSSKGPTHHAHSRVMVTERRNSVQVATLGPRPGTTPASLGASVGRDVHRLTAEEKARFGGMERTRKATSRSNDGRAVVNPRTATGRRLYGPQRYTSTSANGAEPEDAKSFLAKYSAKKGKCIAPVETRGIQIRPSPPSILRPTSTRSTLPQNMPSTMYRSKSMGNANVKFSETGRRQTLGAMPKTLSRFAASGSCRSENGSRRSEGGARKSDGSPCISDGDRLNPSLLESFGFGVENSTSPRFTTPSPPQSPPPTSVNLSRQSPGSAQALPSLTEHIET